jgi:hypothetical protein
MTTMYYIDRVGGILAGDPDLGVASYAYPGSTYGKRALRDPAAVAREMVADQTKLVAEYGAHFGPPLRAAIDRWLGELREHGTPAA